MEQQDKNTNKSVVFTVALFAVVIVSCCLFIWQPWQKNGEIENLDHIDLTAMNSTMVYAYVNDMINTRPDEYLGKTVKAKGQYYTSFYSETQKYYHFVIITDAQACCSEGIEFIYEGEYPSRDSFIVITGTFEKYDELDKTYYYINTTDLSVL